MCMVCEARQAACVKNWRHSRALLASVQNAASHSKLASLLSAGLQGGVTGGFLIL